MENQPTPQDPSQEEPTTPSTEEAPVVTPEPETPVSETPPAEPIAPTPPAAAVVSDKPHTSKAVKAVLVLLVIAVLALGAAYYMQKTSYDDAAAQVTSLQQQLDTSKAAAAAKQSSADTTTTTESTTSPNLIPANVDTGRTDNTVVVTGQYKYSLKPTAVWIAYGSTPAKLDSSTEKVTSELGLGDPGSTYGEMTGSIDSTKLTAGGTYYYQVVATINGKTQVSAVASFTADK